MAASRDSLAVVVRLGDVGSGSARSAGAVMIRSRLRVRGIQWRAGPAAASPCSTAW